MGFDSKESLISELADAIAEEERTRKVRLLYGSNDPRYQRNLNVWLSAKKYVQQCEQAVADWDKPAPMPRAHGSKLIMPASMPRAHGSKLIMPGSKAAKQDQEYSLAVTYARRAGVVTRQLLVALTQAKLHYRNQGHALAGGIFANWPEPVKAGIRDLHNERERYIDSSMTHYKASGKRKPWRDTELGLLARDEKP